MEKKRMYVQMLLLNVFEVVYQVFLMPEVLIMNYLAYDYDFLDTIPVSIFSFLYQRIYVMMWYK